MTLDKVLGTEITEDGVANVTLGMVTLAQVTQQFRELIKAVDQEGYAQYRSIRYPAGEGSDTLETRRESVRFLFDRARDLLTPYYTQSPK